MFLLFRRTTPNSKTCFPQFAKTSTQINPQTSFLQQTPTPAHVNAAPSLFESVPAPTQINPTASLLQQTVASAHVDTATRLGYLARATAAICDYTCVCEGVVMAGAVDGEEGGVAGGKGSECHPGRGNIAGGWRRYWRAGG